MMRPMARPGWKPLVRDLGGSVDLDTGLRALLVVSVVSAAAPFVCALLARFRVPQVVVLIVGGVLIGPEVAGWAAPGSIELVANVGLGFVFLLAGYELDLGHFRERSGRLAMIGWLASAVISIAVTGLLAAAGLVHAFVPVALALTTTALGTLLPILRDNDMLGGSLGRFIMPAGAVGEFFRSWASRSSWGRGAVSMGCSPSW